ncbi:MAG: transporter [Coxiellaceae bacterium]|nr:transporter [Coxiellaceae bacterium]
MQVSRHVMRLLMLIMVIIFAAYGRSYAAQSAESIYFPGTYNDFLVAVIPGAGWYLRDDNMYYSGQLSQGVFTNSVQFDATLNLYMNMLKIAHFTNTFIGGGRFGYGVNLTFVAPTLNSTVIAGRRDLQTTNNVKGLSDTYFIPFMLNWALKHGVYITVYQAILAPTGSYNPTQVLNVGRNYLAFDSDLQFTWLSHDTKKEISFTLGYIVNTMNTAIQYLTGNEIHLDYLLGYHFNANYAIGATGYYYRQVTGDSGRGALLGAFKGYSYGAGPAVEFTIPLNDGKNSLILISKWIHEFHAVNRFRGNEYMVSLATAIPAS